MRRQCYYEKRAEIWIIILAHLHRYSDILNFFRRLQVVDIKMNTSPTSSPATARSVQLAIYKFGNTLQNGVSLLVSIQQTLVQPFFWNFSLKQLTK